MACFVGDPKGGIITKRFEQYNNNPIKRRFLIEKKDLEYLKECEVKLRKLEEKQQKGGEMSFLEKSPEKILLPTPPITTNKNENRKRGPPEEFHRLLDQIPPAYQKKAKCICEILAENKNFKYFSDGSFSVGSDHRPISSSSLIDSILECLKNYPPFCKPKPLELYPGLVDLIKLLARTELSSNIFGYRKLKQMFMDERMKQNSNLGRSWELIENF